jgi:hypothetical protein
MTIVYLLPTLLSALLMAAHFLRAGDLLLMMGCLAVPLLLLIRRLWVAVVMQVLLVLGAGQWLVTMAAIIAERRDNGQRFLGVIYILGAVALFNLVAATAFFLPVLRRRYRGGR